jgi:hypothetical protein
MMIESMLTTVDNPFDPFTALGVSLSTLDRALTPPTAE